MLRYLTIGAGWLILAGFSTLAVVAEDTVERPADPEPTEAQRELVQQLGDAKFIVRERAAANLASQGLAAKAVLVEALQDPDLEIRIRAHTILARVRHDQIETRLAAFIADVDDKEEHNLPGWKPYKDLVGSGRDARKLFAEMVRSEWSLLSAYEKRSSELPQLFAVRVVSLQPQVAGVINVVPSERIATLLLIGSNKAVGQHSPALFQLYSLLNHSTTQQTITAGGYSSILIKLLEQWVTTGVPTSSNVDMMIALKYDLKEAGLQRAKKLIAEQTKKSSSMLSYAIIAIGKYGGEEHIPLLKSLLDNKTVCHTWNNPKLNKEGVIKIEVRDVALVILLRLTGRDPAQYGFKLLRESPETLYYVHTFGFIDGKEREAAHAKWAEEAKALEN